MIKSLRKSDYDNTEELKEEQEKETGEITTEQTREIMITIKYTPPTAIDIDKYVIIIKLYKEHVKRKVIRAADVTVPLLSITYIVIS
jgi:hypothetical protein